MFFEFSVLSHIIVQNFTKRFLGLKYRRYQRIRVTPTKGGNLLKYECQFHSTHFAIMKRKQRMTVKCLFFSIMFIFNNKQQIPGVLPT